MSSLLGATEPPADEETKELMVKCFFYLLSGGISQLNKMGHEEIHDWTSKSPDRVYAWAVNGYPQISAYLEILSCRFQSRVSSSTPRRMT